MKKILLLGFLVLTFFGMKAQTESVRTKMLSSSDFTRRYVAPPALPTMETLLNSIQSTGKFNNETTTAAHLSTNIYKISYEFNNPASTYYNDAEVKLKLYRALNYWLDHYPAFLFPSTAFDDPRFLGIVLLKLRDDFIADESVSEYSDLIANIRLKAEQYMRYNWSSGTSKSTFKKPNLGTDIVDGGHRLGNIGYRLFGLVSTSLALDHAANLDTISTIISNQFALQINTPDKVAEGMLYDGSLHQHGAQMYNVGYGSDWLSDLGRYAEWVDGSPWELTNPEKEAWGTAILNGMQWVYYKGRTAHNIVGRHNQQNKPIYGNVSGFLTLFINRTDNSIPQHAAAVKLKEKFTANSSYQIDSSKYLWNSHIILHHSPNYFASVKMLSKRVKGSESNSAGHGLMNYHVADGSTMIYRTGKEYDNSRVGWNWRAVPGTTVKQKTGALPLLYNSGVDYYSNNTIAGGVTDGDVSIGVFNLNRKHSYHKTKAFKAYFTFPDMMLCLGNSITDSETGSEDIYTTINQTDRNGDVAYAINGGSEQIVPSGAASAVDLNVTSPSWFWHDQTGYIVIPTTDVATNVLLKAETRQGNWYDLDKRNPNATVSTDVFQLSINHGNPSGWKDKSYRYLVVPNVTKGELINFVNTKVLNPGESSLYIENNTSNIISASYGKYTGVLFTGSGNQSATNLGFDNLNLSTTNYAAVLLKRTADGINAYVADLKNEFGNSNPVSLSLNKRMQAQTFLPKNANGTCTVSPGIDNTDVALSLSKTNKIYEGEPVIIKMKTDNSVLGMGSTVAEADTWVRGGTYANKNYGKSNYLVAKSGDQEIILRFNIADVKRPMIAANLKLFSGVLDASTTWELYSIADNSWVEGNGSSSGTGDNLNGITWNTAPATGGLITTVAGTTANQFVKFDISNYLKSLPENQQSVSFRIKSTAPNVYTSFPSRSGGTEEQKPKLEYIYQKPSLTVTSQTQTNPNCFGGSNGSASITVSGGSGNYNYSWAPSGGTAATATGLAAGTYTVTAKDKDDEEILVTKEFTITQPEALVASASAQTNVSCKDGLDGSATVSVTGGTMPYTYLWLPSGRNTQTATGLWEATHRVNITDANGCTAKYDFTITAPDALVASASAQTNVSCNGGADGSATVSVTGGTMPYTYLWSASGGNAATATGLAAGKYTVTVTDANDCTAKYDFMITEPEVLIASASAQTNVSCNGGRDGSATVSVTGGTMPYTYSWSASDGSSASGGSEATATDLTAGTYTVTVTDANGCTATQDFTITAPEALIASASAQTNVSCNGGSNGSATVSVTGGTMPYTYSWSASGGNAATARDLTAGKYTVTVTDANDCTAKYDFMITEPEVLIASASAQTNVSCNGGRDGSATVSVTGGTMPYTYSWSASDGSSASGGSEATATDLTAGTYTVTVTDANGCTAMKSFTITAPEALIASASAQTNISCNGGADGSATVSVTGGTMPYTYSWSASGGNAATAKGLTAGSYTVTVTDANGCTAMQSFTITAPPAFIASASAQTNISCNGGSNGSATVSVTGGTMPYTYSWSASGGNEATARALTAGTYTVTVTDANGCSAMQSFTITAPALRIAASISGSAAVCVNSTAPTITFKGENGKAPYTFTYTINNGNSQSVTTLGTSSTATVSAETRAAGSFEYRLLSVNDATCGQPQNGSAIITVNARPTASVSGNVAVAQNSAAPNVTFTGSKGKAPYTFTYNINGGPNQTITSTGNSATIAASTSLMGNFVYNLVSVADANCSQTQVGSATIIVRPLPVATVMGTASVCNSGAQPVITFTGAAGTAPYTFTYNINGGTNRTIATNTTTATLNVPTNTAGTFVYNLVSVADAYTMQAQTGAATVTVNSLPVIDINSDKGLSISKGDVVVLTATGGAQYSWNGADMMRGQTEAALTIRPRQSGNYTVQVTNANGCTAYKSVSITVIDDYKLEASNVLTPNGDGYNDKFIVKNIDYYPNNTIKIFDRAGRMLYKKQTYANDWDGTVNGAPLTEGTYYYIIDLGAGIGTVKGFINIIKN